MTSLLPVLTACLAIGASAPCPVGGRQIQPQLPCGQRAEPPDPCRSACRVCSSRISSDRVDATPDGVDLPVVQLTLANGMRLLILRREGAPTVSFVTQYAVGGVNEALGSTGATHLLEHLFFKGTTTIGTRDVALERSLFIQMDALEDSVQSERARVPEPDSARISSLRARVRELEDSAGSVVESGEFERILSRNGARGLNATTGSEATTYFVELPANRVKLWFVLEADRMMNPVFRGFYSERDVVMEERRQRVDTDPRGLLYELHMAAAFRVHPYGQPVVGHMSDLERLTRPQIEEFHRRYYGPRNAVVAVVGDIDPDSVAAWATAYLEPVPAGEPPPPMLAREPRQRGERRVRALFDAEPQLRIGWHTVSGRHPDMPALSVMAAILAGGRTSRLFRRMVLEERLATTVMASTTPGARYAQLFVVEAVPRSPHTPEALEEIIYHEIERLGSEPPAEEELERVRNQLEASRVRRLRSNLGLAFQLAASASLWGDWRDTFRLTTRLQEVKAEDIQRVVRAYLLSENRTVAILSRDEDGGDGSRRREP